MMNLFNNNYEELKRVFLDYTEEKLKNKKNLY